MHSTSSLLPKLVAHYPGFSFVAGSTFSWSPDTQTVTYRRDDHADTDDAFLLHELSHALLGHRDYSRDVELLSMEVAAWHQARQLSDEYGVTIDDDVVEDTLDTYRDWLHARSTCPHCQATGIQVARHDYNCVACGGRWHVNEARRCQLRRYKK